MCKSILLFTAYLFTSLTKIHGMPLSALLFVFMQYHIFILKLINVCMTCSFLFECVLIFSILLPAFVFRLQLKFLTDRYFLLIFTTCHFKKVNTLHLNTFDYIHYYLVSIMFWCLQAPASFLSPTLTCQMLT
jgi:hypothetical protein